jgi:phage terminase large subunit-like protein
MQQPILDSISLPINHAEGDYFDEASAERVVKFIEKYCSHVKGSSGAFLLEDWQKHDIIYPLFGWKRADGKRKYRTCYVEIPRKNGKSNLSACIALYMLFADGEVGAEIVSAAGDRNQARIVYDIAAGMVHQSKSLSSAARVYNSEIKYKTSFYKSISAEARTKHGFNCSAVIFDELHTQPDSNLWQVLTTSIASREQPLIVALTTAGHDMNSICYEVHEYALKVRRGEIEDPTFLPIIYNASEDDDWKDENTWKKANPGFGTICKADYFKQQVLEAENSPSNVSKFKRLHLNIWTSLSETWLDDADFMRGKDPLPPDDYLATLDCWCGLDLAATRDLTAFAMLWRESDDRYYLRVHQFVNEERAQQKNADGVDYEEFARKGDVTITPGNVTSFHHVREYIIAQREKFPIQSIAFDRKYSPYIVTELVDAGFAMSPFGQGYYEMSYPTKRVEMAMIEGKIIHGGNSCLRWQIGCTRIDRDPADNIKVTKNKTRQGQMVDGVVASIMAFGEMLKDTENEVSLEVFTL